MDASAKRKKAGLIVVAVALVVIVAVAGTYAWLQDASGAVANTFDTNEVTVTLEETTGGEYNIVPGTTEKKDPKVTVSNSVDTYVFVEVTDTTNGAVTWSIADGWSELADYSGVYYREVAANASGKIFSVLEGDQVSYSSTLTNEDLAVLTGPQLTFKAYAIQKEGFADDTEGDGTGAVKAYRAVALGVPPDAVEATTSEELVDAVSEASDGGTIYLTGDVTLTSPLTIDDDITIIGGDDASIDGQPITLCANATFDHVSFEKPTNTNNNATIVYAYDGAKSLVLRNCTFSNPQWEVVQATSNDMESIVIDGCTFNADAVEGAESSYGNAATQCIRFIHVQPNAYPTMSITITNNTFNDIANVKDSVAGIYYVSTDSTITVGGNAFNGWGEGDVTDGKSPKLSVGWPEVEALKTISVWEGDNATYKIDANSNQ